MNKAPSEKLCEIATDYPDVPELIDVFGLVELDSS